MQLAIAVNGAHAQVIERVSRGIGVRVVVWQLVKLRTRLRPRTHTSWTPTSTYPHNLNSLRYRSDMSSNMLHSMSPTTPGLPGLPHPFQSPNSTHTRGFKRSASSDDDENGDGDTRPSSSSRRNTAVKRACNECRQQKVSTFFFVYDAIEEHAPVGELCLRHECARLCLAATSTCVRL